MDQWLSKDVLVWVSVFSGIALVLSAILVPVVIVRLPVDYFVTERRGWLDRQPTLLRIGLRVLKNLLGIVILVLGVLMLVLPGQGVLAILLGLTLVDFPGKQALQCKLIRKPKVIDGMNWIRRKFHASPLKAPSRC